MKLLNLRLLDRRSPIPAVNKLHLPAFRAVPSMHTHHSPACRAGHAFLLIRNKRAQPFFFDEIQVLDHAVCVVCAIAQVQLLDPFTRELSAFVAKSILIGSKLNAALDPTPYAVLGLILIPAPAARTAFSAQIAHAHRAVSPTRRDQFRFHLMCIQSANPISSQYQ